MHTQNRSGWSAPCSTDISVRAQPAPLLSRPALRPQEQMEDMRKKEEHLEKEMQEVSAQNRRLAEPLTKAREEMNEMRKKLGDHKRDKQILVVRCSFAPCRPCPGRSQAQKRGHACAGWAHSPGEGPSLFSLTGDREGTSSPVCPGRQVCPPASLEGLRTGSFW